MRKKLLIASMLSLILLFTGCSAILSGGKITETMDFDAKMELKSPNPPVGDMPKVLFVGNSHTFSNDLPSVFWGIIESRGQEAEVYDLTEGYYTLERFADPEDELGAVLKQALSEEKWDFVIFQENSGMAVSPTADKDMFPYARTLDKMAKDANAQSAFLMTWSPKNGAESELLTLSREEVQSMIAKNYITISEGLDDLLIPAGVAFMRCAKKYPEIELWDEDEQHPSLEGTYLAACTAYATFYQQSPEGCAYTADLPTDVAGKLQTIAADLILK